MRPRQERIASVVLATATLLATPALAQMSGLQPPPPLPALPPASLLEQTWMFVLEGQRELTGGMTAALHQLKAGDPVRSAAVLALISFLYGILHAIGPGHGKFVVSSYALANEKTVRRGILLSFMAAFIQALSAIVLVGILSLALRATSIQVRATEAWLETASWGLIAGLGAWLLWGQVKPLLAVRSTHRPADRHAHHDHSHHASLDHASAHNHGPHHGHSSACAAPGHVHDEHCGHAHMATPDQLQGPWNWREAWALAFSIGIRPCTGAIGVLLTALALGMLWAGIFATFAMAIGTAITVSTLAAIAVGSRDLSTRIAGGADSRWAPLIARTAGIAGSGAVLLLGAVFFIASLRGPPPL